MSLPWCLPVKLSIFSDSDISINTTDLINRNEYPMVLQIINSELEYPNDEERLVQTISISEKPR